VPVPSLNIHMNRAAENPSVAGGSAVDPTKPGPWVTWQERTSAPVNGREQIFAERPIGPGATNCDGVTPAGVPDGAGHVPAIGGFCFQQSGIPCVGPSGADPSLNVDPTRNGIEPDIAFAGPGDSVPWVVWYETGKSSLSGLRNNQLVFAAKAVSDDIAGNGGFHWVAVGAKAQFTINTQGEVHHWGDASIGFADGRSRSRSVPATAARPVMRSPARVQGGWRALVASRPHAVQQSPAHINFL